MGKLDLQTLTASTIHELKNLLGQLTLSLDEITQIGCPGADEKLSGARFACRRISDRMVELLALYKLEGSPDTTSVDAHSPADFVEDLQCEASALAAGRITVENACADGPSYWFFDRDLVQGALMNAMHNALDHANGRIVVRSYESDGGLVFSVEDDGPGFSAELLQSDLSAPRISHKGAGLGLYFAQMVAQAHKNKGRTGYVKLANAPQGGAVFSLWVP